VRSAVECRAVHHSGCLQRERRLGEKSPPRDDASAGRESAAISRMAGMEVPVPMMFSAPLTLSWWAQPVPGRRCCASLPIAPAGEGERTAGLVGGVIRASVATTECGLHDSTAGPGRPSRCSDELGVGEVLPTMVREAVPGSAAPLMTASKFRVARNVSARNGPPVQSGSRRALARSSAPACSLSQFRQHRLGMTARPGHPVRGGMRPLTGWALPAADLPSDGDHGCHHSRSSV